MEASIPMIRDSIIYTRIDFDPESAEIIGYHVCGMDESNLDDVEAWLHEFVEMHLWTKPGMQKDIVVTTIGGGHYIMTIAHVLASLCHGARYDDENRSPEWVAEQLNWRRRDG